MPLDVYSLKRMVCGMQKSYDKECFLGTIELVIHFESEEVNNQL